MENMIKKLDFLSPYEKILIFSNLAFIYLTGETMLSLPCKVDSAHLDERDINTILSLRHLQPSVNILVSFKCGV